MTKKVNPKNTRDTNGRTEKAVKDYSKGTIAKGKHDVASKNVHAKYGITGDGPKKTAHTRVKKG